jgi:hypothetical protein
LSEVIEYDITNDSLYVVIASDGVWEFLDNDKVASIVSPFYKSNDASGASQALLNEATQCWLKVNINYLFSGRCYCG